MTIEHRSENDIALEQFLEIAPIPGQIIFAKVWGSRSYNLHKAGSDWDFAGVYVAPLKDLIGLYPLPRMTERDGEKPDFQFHEVGHFAKLLLHGNATAVEMLFTDHFYQAAGIFLDLMAERRRFMTQKVVQGYLDYAAVQLIRLNRGQYVTGDGGRPTEKWMYKIVRLLREAERFVAGQPPSLWLEDEDREYIMKYRTGDLGLGHLQAYCFSKRNHIERLKPWPLPKKADERYLNDWLVRARLE